MSVKKNDLFMGLYLLAAVIFFIISIPSWLLDIMLAINIGIALIIYLIHYMQKRFWIWRHIRPCCSLRHCFVFR